MIRLWFVLAWCAIAPLMLPSLAQAADTPPVSTGQTVYVPVYSHVLHGNQNSRGKPESWLLSAMLSIRNTDADLPIRIRSIRYYDSDGKMLRDYTPAQTKLGPMASAEVFIEQRDETGGAGANFVVTWDAAQPVDPPLIETVHSYFFGTQSAIFTSRGQLIRPQNR